jgi:predicted transcriptional regulator
MSGVQKIYRRDGQPFSVIPNELIRDPEVSQTAFRLIAYLMSHANGYELTYGQIEAQTGLGRFAINGAIKVLQAKGWLEVRSTKLSNGQFGPKAWTVLNPSTVGNSTAGDSVVEQHTDKKKNIPLEEQLLETLPHPTGEDAFEEFWKLYPRRVEKLDAHRAFDRAYSEHGEDVLYGVRRLIADPNLPPKRFIPYPASWLRAGGWTNEPYPERELSPEERRQAELTASRADRDRRRLEHEALVAQMEEARRNASPPPECEHGRTIVSCLVCAKRLADAEQSGEPGNVN